MLLHHNIHINHAPTARLSSSGQWNPDFTCSCQVRNHISSIRIFEQNILKLPQLFIAKPHMFP